MLLEAMLMELLDTPFAETMSLSSYCKHACLQQCKLSIPLMLVLYGTIQTQ